MDGGDGGKDMMLIQTVDEEEPRNNTTCCLGNISFIFLSGLVQTVWSALKLDTTFR